MKAIIAALAVVGVALVQGPSVAGQNGQGGGAPTRPARATQSAPTPRTAEGKVDFSGIWSADRNFIYYLHDALKKGE